MTVDMLTAAFIWPEEVLIGRALVGNDSEPTASAEPMPPAEAASEPDAMPFWAALMHRLRSDPAVPRAGAR